MSDVVKDAKGSLSERISSLEAENRQMREQISGLKEILREIIPSIDRSYEMIEEWERRSGWTERVMVSQISNLPYELLDPQRPPAYHYPRFEPQEETVRKIVEEGMSMARFGDGEFSIMGHVERQKFQHLDDRLAKRLIEVLHSHRPDLIIAVADNYGSLSKYNENGAGGIRLYMTPETRLLHESLLEWDRVYADAYLTRFYALYGDNMTDAPARRLANLRRMWEGRHVITVEGAETRLGVGNDLFDQAASFRRILAPATSSFDRYDELLEAALISAADDTLFLLAVGPSSGVLAYDLTCQGYQALDIGHLDLEYEWFRAGKGERVAVPTRYNNEWLGGDQVEPIHDPVYESQVIARFL